MKMKYRLRTELKYRIRRAIFFLTLSAIILAASVHLGNMPCDEWGYVHYNFFDYICVAAASASFAVMLKIADSTDKGTFSISDILLVKEKLTGEEVSRTPYCELFDVHGKRLKEGEKAIYGKENES